MYCLLLYRPTRHTKQENRAYFGARSTPACTLLAAARDVTLGRCVLLLYIAPAAAVVLRLLLRLLVLLLLQLLRGCDKNGAGDSRLGDYKMCEGSEPFFYKRNKNEQKIVKVHQNLSNNLGCSKSPARFRGAKRNPLLNRASSATFNAPSTATELGRNPDMLHHVPMAALLATQPKVREETVGRRRAASRKKRRSYVTYTYRSSRSSRSCISRYGTLCKICAGQIQPKKHVLHYADHRAPTRQMI